MSGRLYDYIITVADASDFENGNTLLGLTSKAFGYISNVDTATNNLKVKMSNLFQEYNVSETVTSNHYLISNVLSVQSFSSTATSNEFTLTGDTIPVANTELDIFVEGRYRHETDWYFESPKVVFRDFALPGTNTVLVRRQTGNTEARTYQASTTQFGNTQISATSTVSAINNSPFIATLNSYTQPPIVRLIDIYYPGEWYPPNKQGNPSGSGEGYSWPTDMPIRIAEVIGDFYSDLQYNVSFGSQSYIPYPVEVDGINTSSDGTIDRVTFTMSNYDNLITVFVENPYLVGNVTSNSAQGYVNGELVYGLDPRTVTGNTHFDQTVVDTVYGKVNSAWTYDEAVKEGETWRNLKADSRDLLGAVVEIRTTFASHLRYWPEHSKLDFVNANVVSVLNGGPYRVGDNVKTETSSTVQISDIQEDRIFFLSDNLDGGVLNQNLYVVNDDHDEEAYIKDTFKITALRGLDQEKAEFELTSWLQYFKLQLPKRKYYKNTCQWVYKGSECQYPGPGELTIPGTFPEKKSNADPIFANNVLAVSDADDECGKSYEACRIRNNTIHFGGFPGTGRQIPKQ